MFHLEVDSALVHLSTYSERKKRTTLPQIVSSLDRNNGVLNYLTKLSAPAVDLQIRSLCNHASDEEGIALLRLFAVWLAYNLASNDNFEVVQAYLHRFLTVYSSLVLEVPNISADVCKLKAIQSSSSEHFRNLLQRNLSLLKLMANIPIS